jgi:hypothetical protein
MDSVYLLLRNNQQSGPFTIDELLQQQLKPSDMIWIEGKSTAWTYLSELELIPFIKKAETSSQVRAVNIPDEIERKAEELRQRVLNASQRSYFQNHPPEIVTYSSPYKLDDEIQFIDYRKEKRLKKNTALAELLLTCFVIGLFMLGIYNGKSFVGARHKVQNSVATQLNSGDQHTAKRANNQTNSITVSVIDTTTKSDSSLTFQKGKPKPVKKEVDSLNADLVQPATVINQEEKKEEAIINPLPVSQEAVTKKKEDTPIKKEIVSPIPENKTVSEPAKEEKKGFLRGLFKKKKDKGE